MPGMAMLKKLSIDDSQLPVPPLAEDAEFAPAAQLLSALSARYELVKDVITLVQLEEYLRPRAFNPKSPADIEARHRLRFLRAKVKLGEIYEPVATAGVRPEIAKAMKLLQGEPVAAPITPAARLEQCHRELAVLDDAIRAQNEILEEIRARKALELAQRLARRNDELLVAHFRAAQQLVRATAAVRELHAAVIAGGYGPPRSDFMPAYLARGALLLGEETVHGSDISTVRRQLEQRGLV
jgi:hypothetical protein